MKPKILVILGPTATGKSDLAVKIAQKFNGEIISADSRQVYKGLDIGTGKITKKEMRGVPHHLLDVIYPNKRFSVADYKIQAERAINEILSRGNLPILVGGTGFYIQSIVDGIVLPEVAFDKKLRKKLETYSLEKLQKTLQKLDLVRFKEIDTKNSVRLIRAIEIATVLGKVPKQKKKPRYEVLQIGLSLPDGVLRKKIHTRLSSRMKQGVVAEAKKLHKNRLSWKRMEELGLEYRYLSRHLQGKISKKELLAELEKAIWHYARRQKTWFKKDKRIVWFTPSKVEGFSPSGIEKIEKEAERFFK